MLEDLQQLRSQLERCRVLLRSIETSEEACNTIYEHVTHMKLAIDGIVTRTNKCIIITKNKHSIPIEPAEVKPARLVREQVVDEEALAILQKEYEEQERACEKRRREREARRTIKYHPDPKMHQLIKLHQEMGGVQLDKFIKPFVLPTPEMELWDILEFLNKIKRQREEKGLYNKSSVYIHLCEYGTFYVGYSTVNFQNNGTKTVEESARQRLADHRNWSECQMRANWTGLFRIVSMLFYMPGTKEDEQALTLLLHNCLSGSKVRGGEYTNIGFVDIPEVNICEIKKQLQDRS